MKGRKKTMFLAFSIIAAALLSSCSPRIYGTVQLVDVDMKPIEDESPEGTVVNMINTTAGLEEASHSVSVDKENKFESSKGAITPGTYKVEVGRIGYVTETETVEIGKFTGKELNISLKKIPEGKRRSIEGAQSDEDKIINPGEVNIRPPMM